MERRAPALRYSRPIYGSFRSEDESRLHGSRDGLTTLCGRTIDHLWAERDELLPGCEGELCGICRGLLPRILKTPGKQERLP